jgi:hypothetical protein
MKKWITDIVLLRGQAKRICATLNECIEKIALDPFSDTMKQCKRIFMLDDRRIAVLNMVKLFSIMIANLNIQERAVLSLYCRGATVSELAEAMNISQRRVYYKISLAFKKSENALLKLGYDEKRLDAEYSILRSVIGEIKKVKRKKNNLENKIDEKNIQINPNNFLIHSKNYIENVR